MGEQKKKTPVQKLSAKIKKDFPKKTYIGDISINEEEYEILVNQGKKIVKRIIENEPHVACSQTLAVLLVQIGMRYYKGSFWNHVQSVLRLEKLSGNHQQWIGHSFYWTLVKYNKLKISENEMVNNILMHCFITSNYSDELFDFLFSYYQIDLDRDLSRNTPDMKDHLINSMKKGEDSVRSFKIKRHTADAVTANIRGCKLRVNRILCLMDNALFKGELPESSRNRIFQLFVQWAKKSEKLVIERKKLHGIGRKGRKLFSSPYIHYDYKKEKFILFLPSQNVLLDENENIPELMWEVSYGGKSDRCLVIAKDSVTGCKTEPVKSLEIPPLMIFDKITISLIKNSDDIVKSFRINDDSVRFFDKDLDQIIYGEYLPVGDCYAFTRKQTMLRSDSVVDTETRFGLKFYTFSMTKGDVISLDNAWIKSIGKPLEEGLISGHRVDGAYIINENEKYNIYGCIPDIFFNNERKAGEWHVAPG